MTPAMAADVTGKLWEIADIVALIEAKEAGSVWSLQEARLTSDNQLLDLIPIPL